MGDRELYAEKLGSETLPACRGSKSCFSSSHPRTGEGRDLFPGFLKLSGAAAAAAAFVEKKG